MVRSGSGNRRTWCKVLLIALLTVGFLMPAPTPVMANTKLIVGSTLLGVFLVPLIALGVYENLPSQQGKERLLKGEFYVGGYMGPAFTPSQSFRSSNGFSLSNPAQTSVFGGAKFGYFCHRIPYLGVELETNVSRSIVRGATLSLSSPLRGFRQGIVPQDNWLNLLVAFHIVGRYGFLKDQEVPFGRLQPYVGVGPAGVIHFTDEAKTGNYGIDVMAGVRYMLLKNVSTFVEYKYTHVWDESVPSYFTPPNGRQNSVQADFDYNSHKVALGVALHF